jgi:MarR family transcriptional regulator, 2-MHQ and catechol-resistance regulon repressor
MTDPATQRALHLWVVLNRAQSAVAAHATRDAARHDLTLAEFGALEALYHKGPLTVGALQRKILISSGGITFLIDRLMERGLVERRTSTEDRRNRLVGLTPKGHDLVAAIFPEHAERVTHALSGVSAATQETLTNELRTLGLAAEKMMGSGE